MAEVSAGSVELAPVRLVDPDGSPTAEDRYSRDLPPETLSWLYEMMVVTRELDTEFINLQRQGELALFASCRGQEAAQIGATASLRKTDWLFPQYREIGAFLLRGITPAQMGAVWRASGTVGSDSPRSVARRYRSRSARTDCMRWARRWQRNGSARIR